MYDFVKIPLKIMMMRKMQEAQSSMEHFFKYLLERNIYLPPADLESFFVSCMHTKKELKYFAEEIKNYFSNHSKRGELF